MSEPVNANMNSDVHFRAPDDFMSRVHAAARPTGINAACFMRKAILDAIRRQEAEHRSEAA